MLVADVRNRLLEKVGQVAAGGDEDDIAKVMAYARAVLIALARHASDGEVALPDLEVETRSAALILGLHPEYIRFLVRQGRLQAKKENGEFRIALSDVVDHLVTRMKSPGGTAGYADRLWAMLRWEGSPSSGNARMKGRARQRARPEEDYCSEESTSPAAHCANWKAVPSMIERSAHGQH